MKEIKAVRETMAVNMTLPEKVSGRGMNNSSIKGSSTPVATPLEALWMEAWGGRKTHQEFYKSLWPLSATVTGRVLAILGEGNKLQRYSLQLR